MIKVDKIKVFNFEGALRGLRNPKESWNMADSEYESIREIMGAEYVDRPILNMGESDYKLAETLAKSGSDHSKYLRQIGVTMDITAPLYWWKEFDTYKVGTVANSTSTMHKILSRPIDADMFSWDTEEGTSNTTAYRESIIKHLEELRIRAIETGDKEVWRELIQDLPSSFNQTRTVTLNYQVLRTIYHSDRKHHKLIEWRVFCGMINTLPYAHLITVRVTTKEERALKKELELAEEKIEKLKEALDNTFFGGKLKEIAQDIASKLESKLK